MAENVTVCNIDDDLKEKMKKFRFRKEKNSAAIIMKINKDSMTVVMEDELEDVTIEEVAGELPESQPRYVLYSFPHTHSDGRVSYPMVFIFVSPVGCKPEMNMMYAGSKKNLVQEAQLTKVFEIREPEDITQEWLEEKIAFFR